MSVYKRIEILEKVGEYFSDVTVVDEIAARAYSANSWFEPRFVKQSLEAICKEFLNKEKLQQWLAPYCIEDEISIQQTVGIICAGNVPLVGFHDFLCCYVLGVPVKLKLSSRDNVLMRLVINEILKHDKDYAKKFAFVERLTDFNAVIATGSSSSNRYFEYYFSKYPSILRSNRVSVAVLSGNETQEQLAALADDVFMYFGLGCRNVAKLYVPEKYSFENLFPAFKNYEWLHHNSQFMNNYDYHRTLLLMNKTPHLANEFLMIQESDSLYSSIGTLFYEVYHSTEELKSSIEAQKDNIQCVVGDGEGYIPFGKAQQPTLSDYADGKDTVGFLLGL